MQVSHTLLDIGLLVGALLSILNGVELVVRPHQRKQIQEFFENMTLWLDYVTVPDLKNRLTDPGVYILLSVTVSVSWLLFIGVFGVAFQLSNRYVNGAIFTCLRSAENLSDEVKAKIPEIE